MGLRLGPGLDSDQSHTSLDRDWVGELFFWRRGAGDLRHELLQLSGGAA